MKKLVALGSLALAVAAYWAAPRPGEAPTGVAPAESAPLSERVTKVMRHSARSPAALAHPRGAEEAVAEIHRTRACLDSGDCAYPSDDPQAYSFAVSRDLAEKMRALREEHGGDPSFQGELEALAREMMAINDGYVQAEAIQAFSLYPPSSENLHAMVAGLEHTADPLIVRQAMNEWRRYLGSRDEALVTEALSHLVARGGQFTGEAASSEIDAFLNERTAPAFREALASMRPTATAAVNLRRALQQYDRRVSGG